MLKEKTKNFKSIFRKLKQKYPNPKTALEYKNAFEFLIAVILSAQCTDQRVNQVTPVLFSKYSTVEALSKAKLDDVKKIIYSTGFYNNKAKNIINLSKELVKNFASSIPKKMEDLLTLPGVARKTANAVLNEIYNLNEGIVVDTHVIRLSNRLGFLSPISTKNPEKIEKILMEIVSKNDYGLISHLLIQHGRLYCKAKKPNCSNCFLNKDCPYFNN